MWGVGGGRWEVKGGLKLLGTFVVQVVVLVLLWRASSLNEIGHSRNLL